MNVDILGRRWRVSVLAANAFQRRFVEEYAGITCPETQEIVISEDSLNLDTVSHEVFHAAKDSLCIGSAGLSDEQLEEVYAEMFARHGVNLAKLSRNLYRALKKEYI